MREHETTLVLLPEPIAKAVDRGVEEFAEQHDAERVTMIKRWHGAHLWQVIAEARISGDKATDSGSVAFVSHRATIAAYSDCPDILIFTPDAVVTRPEGRYILGPDQRAAGQIRLPLVQLVSELRQASDDGAITIRKKLDSVWTTSLPDFSPDGSWVLLP